MHGQPIAAQPLGQAGLGALNERFPGSPPLEIRIDAVLAIVGEAAEVRAASDRPESAAADQSARARRP